MNNIGTVSMGIKLPVIKEGDNLNQIILNSLEEIDNHSYLENGDILGITESVLARSSGIYCTKEDIIADLKQKYPNTNTIILYEPIASRNRFSFILQAIAETFKNVIVVWNKTKDEVGNDLYLKHPFTGIIYKDFYDDIVTKTGSNFSTITISYPDPEITLDCRCHVDNLRGKYGLKDICSNISKWGVLGSNVAGSNKLKLFPDNAQQFCETLKQQILDTYLVHVDVLVYGDGCFKDPVGEIWEFADPITCPGTTISWDKTPNELKLKLLAETKSESEIKLAIQGTQNKHQALGTTPRRVNDLLASLMDLTSGSGSKGTPIVLVKNYFKDYTN